MQTIDEYNTEYVILFEKIGNYLPNEKDFMFNLPFHESVIYPVDLIEISNMYVTKNELGYVYPISVLEYDSLDNVFANCSKDKKVKTLKQLCTVLEDIHNNGIFLNGFDKKQLLVKSDEIKIRYNGFKNHNRNSIYRVPDCYAENYSNIPWVLDIFSLVAIIFECMYEWNPFFGMMTSFSSNEEYQFEVFYNNFKKKIFIFDQERKLNQIGFLVEQRPIVEKWTETDKKICDFIAHILTMDIPKKYTQEFVFKNVYELIDYYDNVETFH